MFFKKNNKQKSAEVRRKIEKMTAEISEIWSGENKKSITDTDGSYTGNPQGFDVPVQDADDL